MTTDTTTTTADGGRAGWGSRLARVTAERGRLCVGLDPHPQVLAGWGLDDDVASVERCMRSTVAALGDLVAVFKPQSALYERFGSAGVAVLERLLADIAATGALALMDAKRGDIGSTMAGYAAAYLTDGSPLAADALTVNPYLGLDAVAPALDAARASGRGVYLLARTSNPGSGWLQLASSDGRTVAQLVCDAAAEQNAAELAAGGGSGLGSVGVVVGGTHGQGDLDLSSFNGSVLVPGVGAQGATLADLARSFARADLLLPTSSRGVLAAGPDAAALRRAVTDLLSEAGVLGGGPAGSR
ncbi:orotidine-5'-phosphate decarboxylase [Auraticoccus sp. F435]|uniref:Orotidine-5'-phosphate decarboxylase n=1 Tax=Auraticoccus cholistanensis TaxID=2656650 RepID=A0A6A9USX6_9ACTN|nr:orotidine-5'-phosphate decarboxylase [Auraticoccus cholistanensis]MVA75923.1 orotidine-5'-phosphate decarboxylase [Auraticoccus cholistanensis]